MNGIATNPDRSRPVQPPTIFHLGAPTSGVTSLPLVTTAFGTRFHAVTASLTTTARRAHPARPRIRLSCRRGSTLVSGRLGSVRRLDRILDVAQRQRVQLGVGSAGERERLVLSGAFGIDHDDLAGTELSIEDLLREL